MGKQIPLDITISILCRLHVKSLLRFLCVSKQWSLAIKDENFVKLHLKQHANSINHIRLVYIFNGNPFSSMDLNSMDTEKLHFPFSWGIYMPPANIIRLVGACNGLICISTWDWDKYDLHSDRGIALWNMSTGKRLILPTLPRIHSRLFLESIGFGYDSINNDYKVILILSTLNTHLVIFYSLRLKSWGKFKKWNSYHILANGGAYVNVAVHWLASTTWDRKFTFIVAWNVHTEEQHILQLPHQMRSSRFASLLVGELGGELFVLYQSNWTKPVEIWVMKKYGMEDSWTRLFSIPRLWEKHSRISCFKNGDEEVLIVARYCIVYYNLCNKSFRCVAVADAKQALIYHQSLTAL